MCPDKRLLSIYVDNELPSPWREKLESHLAECPECRVNAGRYAAVSRRGAEGSARRGAADDGMAAAKERVWEALTRRGLPICRSGPERTPAWRRTIRLPVPLAVAAGVAVAAALGVFLAPGRRPPEHAAPWIAPLPRGALDMPALAPFEFDAQAAGAPASMDDILSVLEADERTNVVIIKLPEKKNYNRSGGPLLLRAVDYDNASARGKGR